VQARSRARSGSRNTITTQAVMTVSPVEKPVASAAYGFVLFIGGGLAPYAAERVQAEQVAAPAPGTGLGVVKDEAEGAPVS
jgi:hypothetical protein